jgi:hypothetical protein
LSKVLREINIKSGTGICTECKIEFSYSYKTIKPVMCPECCIKKNRLRTKELMKTNYFFVYFSKEELEVMKKLANEQGLTVKLLCRFIIKKYIGERL